MKKKYVAAILCAALAFSVAGCGSNKGNVSSTEITTEEATTTESTERTESAYVNTTGKTSFEMNIDPAAQVSVLADYSNIPVTIAASYEINDSNTADTLDQVLAAYDLNVKEVTDRTIVEENDYVNVDYTGYQDGEAFSGGSATDQMLDVSGNCAVGGQTGFIEGFTAGLVGAEVGKTTSYEVTFPEDYGVDSLNGQTVTFEFKVNGIYAPMTQDDITDEMVAEKFESQYGLTNKEELMNFVNDYMENNKLNAVVSEIKDKVVADSTIDIPSDYLAARLQEYEANYAANVCQEGQTLDDYFKTNYNTSLFDAEDSLAEFIAEQIKVEFAFLCIADEQKIEADQDDCDSYVQNYISSSSYNFETEDDVYKYFGAGDVEAGKKYIQDLYRINKAIDYVAEQATVSFE